MAGVQASRRWLCRRRRPEGQQVWGGSCHPPAGGSARRPGRRGGSARQRRQLSAAAAMFPPCCAPHPLCRCCEATLAGKEPARRTLRQSGCSLHAALHQSPAHCSCHIVQVIKQHGARCRCRRCEPRVSPASPARRSPSPACIGRYSNLESSWNPACRAPRRLAVRPAAAAAALLPPAARPLARPHSGGAQRRMAALPHTSQLHRRRAPAAATTSAAAAAAAAVAAAARARSAAVAAWRGSAFRGAAASGPT